MASPFEPNLDEHDEADSRAKELELGRRRLLDYQLQAQELAHRDAELAKMIRASTEPFMDLLIRHANADAAHGKALGKWFHDGSPPNRMPQGHDVPNPESIDERELRRFSKSEFRTICLFRVGRLASTGQVNSILAVPRERDDPIDRFLVSHSWHRKGGRESDDQPMLDPRHFPPPLAKEMLEYVETTGRELPIETPILAPVIPVDPVASKDSPSPALTSNQSRVLKTMAIFDASRLVTAETIAAEMDSVSRLSARTIGPIVQKLIAHSLAERPEGPRHGARLTTEGRRLAQKIAD